MDMPVAVITLTVSLRYNAHTIHFIHLNVQSFYDIQEYNVIYNMGPYDIPFKAQSLGGRV